MESIGRQRDREEGERSDGENEIRLENFPSRNGFLNGNVMRSDSGRTSGKVNEPVGSTIPRNALGSRSNGNNLGRPRQRPGEYSRQIEKRQRRLGATMLAESVEEAHFRLARNVQGHLPRTKSCGRLSLQPSGNAIGLGDSVRPQGP